MSLVSCKNIRLGRYEKERAIVVFCGLCGNRVIFGIGRKIPMNRVNDLGQSGKAITGEIRLGEGIAHMNYTYNRRSKKIRII